MLDIQYVILNLITFSIFFIGIKYENEHVYWNGVFTFISSILFLVLAFGSMSIEVPYELYNPSTTAVVTAFHSYVLGYWTIYIYFGFFIASFAYFLDLIFHEQLMKVLKR